MSSSQGPLPYLSVGGVELANAARTLSYLRNGLGDTMQGHWELGVGDLCSVLYRLNGGDCVTPDVFVSPAADPAPWYDAAEPGAAAFLGVVLLNLDGYDSTATRVVTPRIQDLGGGTFSGQRRTQRTWKFRAALVSASDAGAEYGLRWLTSVLEAPFCDTCDTSEATVRLVCPPDDCTDEELGEWTSYDVALVEGPTEVESYSPRPQSFQDTMAGCRDFVTVEWTMVAGNPFLYKRPVVCLDAEIVGGDTTSGDFDNIFGHPALESNDDGWQGSSAAGKFTAARSGNLVEVTVWAFPYGGTKTMRAAVFADDNGGSDPGTRLGISADLAVPNVGVGKLAKFRVVVPGIVAGTSYWLGVGADAGTGVRLYTGSPGNTSVRWIADPTLPPNWAGSWGGARGPLSIYATVYEGAADFEGGFETGDLSEYDGDWQQAAGRFTAVASDASVNPREGAYMGRVEVRSGDDPIATGGNICEVYRDPAFAGHGDVVGDDRYYAFSVYLPDSFPYVPSSLFNYFFELHGDSGGQAPFKLGINSIISGSNPSVGFVAELETGASPAAPTQTLWRLGDLITDAWVDFVVRVKWKQDATGIIQVWMNDTQVVDQSGIQTWYTAGMATARVQLGYYRASYSETAVLYLDAFRSGSTFASVQPRLGQECTDICDFLFGPPGEAHCCQVAPPDAGVLGAIFTFESVSGMGPILLQGFAQCPASDDATADLEMEISGVPAAATVVVDSARHRVTLTTIDPVTGDPVTEDAENLIDLSEGRGLEWIEAADCDTIGCFCARTAHPCSQGGDTTVAISTQLREG